MYIKDGIAYADEPYSNVDLLDFKFLDNYKILAFFSNGVEKTINLEPILNFKVFEELKDINIFKSGYLDSGVLTWLNGKIDIPSESLFENNFESW